MVRILLFLVAVDFAVEFAPVLIHSRDARLTAFVLACVFLALPVLGLAGPRGGLAANSMTGACATVLWDAAEAVTDCG